MNHEHASTVCTENSFSEKTIDLRTEELHNVCPVIFEGITKGTLGGASDIVAPNKITLVLEGFGNYYQIKRALNISRYELVRSICDVLQYNKYVKEGDVIFKIVKKLPDHFSVQLGVPKSELNS